MPKRELDSDVLTAARQRADQLYEEYEHIFVAHSAGKDSTSAFNVVMDAWDRNGGHENPVKIIHNCTEFKYPEERDYFDRVWRRYDDETYTYWAIMPVLKSLLVNEKQTWRFPYDERDKDKWVHDIPDFSEYDNVELVLPDHPFMEEFQIGWKHSDVGNEIVRNVMGARSVDDYDESAVVVTGLRAQESMVRYGAIQTHGGFLNVRETAPWDEAHPVYDWTAKDIWAVHEQEDWDYNHAYDKMHQAGYAPTKQRNGPMWGPYPIRSQDAYRIRHWYPELFERAERRFEGCHFAFEFGIELFRPDKPEELSWREFAAQLLNSMNGEQQEQCRETIQNRLERHDRRSSVPLKEETECPACGESWESLAKYLYGRLNEHYEEVH